MACFYLIWRLLWMLGLTPWDPSKICPEDVWDIWSSCQKNETLDRISSSVGTPHCTLLFSRGVNPPRTHCDINSRRRSVKAADEKSASRLEKLAVICRRQTDVPTMSVVFVASDLEVGQIVFCFFVLFFKLSHLLDMTKRLLCWAEHIIILLACYENFYLCRKMHQLCNVTRVGGAQEEILAARLRAAPTFRRQSAQKDHPRANMLH